MRVGCAHDREGTFFRPFRTPELWAGGWPAPGSAVLQLGLVWQAKQALAEKKAAEEAEKVRSPRALDAFGLGRTASGACSCGEWQHPSHSHGALCRAPRDAIARARAYGGAMGATACAFALL